MGFLELVETAGGQACVTACGTTEYIEQEEQTAESPYLFNSTADPVSIKLDIVFLQHLPLHGFKNDFVADIFQKLNSNNSLCSSKESTDHKLFHLPPQYHKRPFHSLRGYPRRAALQQR